MLVAKMCILKAFNSHFTKALMQGFCGLIKVAFHTYISVQSYIQLRYIGFSIYIYIYKHVSRRYLHAPFSCVYPHASELVRSNSHFVTSDKCWKFILSRLEHCLATCVIDIFYIQWALSFKCSWVTYVLRVMWAAPSPVSVQFSKKKLNLTQYSLPVNTILS